MSPDENKQENQENTEDISPETPTAEAAHNQIPQPFWNGHTWVYPPMRPVRTPRIVGLPEKLLLPVAFLVAVLFDRLIMAQVFESSVFVTASIFWLFYLVAFYGFYWQKLKGDAVAWLIAASVALLALWNVLYYGSNTSFAALTFFVIPAAIMAHLQWVAGGYSLREHEGVGLAWIVGWIIKPFVGMAALFEAFGSLFAKGNRPVLLRIFIGIGVAVGLMLVIIPLLMTADQMFRFHVMQLIQNINLPRVLFHSFVVLIAFGVVYSLLWDVGFGRKESYKMSSTWKIDPLISSIALVSIIVMYVLFSAVLFTYLFAQAGLPAGMTYAEYARTGFAQTVTISIINFAIIGFFLRFGIGIKKEHGKSLIHVLLLILLALTFVMLFSGAARLNLYIGTFGMTWFRLLSAWFLIYLAVVAILGAIKLLISPKLPVALISAIFLLLWHIALGFANPDGFIAWFNA